MWWLLKRNIKVQMLCRFMLLQNMSTEAECIPFHKLNRNTCLYLLICNKIGSIAKKIYFDIVESELNVIHYFKMFT